MSGAWYRNMSAPPRTTVRCDQHSVSGTAVAFSIHGLLQRAGQSLPFGLKARIRQVGLEGLDSNELAAGLTHIDPEARVDVLHGDDEPPLLGVLVGWRHLGHDPGRHGTTLIGGAVAFAELSYCTDVTLTLRVLSRCESLLYLGHREPRGELRQLADGPMIFDDPRLAALPDLAPAPGSPWPQSRREAEKADRRRAKRRTRDAARRKALKAAARKAARGKKRAPGKSTTRKDAGRQNAASPIAQRTPGRGLTTKGATP